MSLRVLVLGGAGFIGSHLCKKLLTKGYHVICMDNLSCGNKDNLIGLTQNSKFEFIYHDVVEPFKVEVDQIYNLACPASPVHYQSNAIKTIKTSILGAIHSLGAAKKLKARILLASTSEVYGDPKVHPQREDYWGNVNPTGIRACYDEGKRCAETLFFDYHRQNHVDIRVIRIFNTYGPNMQLNDGRVVSNFIVQALRNEPLTIYGDGKQTRSFCYIDDLIDGIIRTMEQTKTIGPINLGNPNEFTIQELCQKVIQLTKTRSSIIHQPLPQDDPTRRCPDITLAKEFLHWEPKIQLNEGLEKTIPYFQKMIHNH